MKTARRVCEQWTLLTIQNDNKPYCVGNTSHGSQDIMVMGFSSPLPSSYATCHQSPTHLSIHCTEYCLLICVDNFPYARYVLNSYL